MKTLPLLFENSEILVINKPSGIAVQGGEKVSNPVDEVLSKQIGQKVFPVHRLDKDTAGILVVAKTSIAARKWTNIICSGGIKKQYSAICSGELIDNNKISFPSGVISTPIGKGNEKKSALTEYKIINSTKIPIEAEEISLSFFELTLGTGRMHQIRIHLAQAGCPIVADDKYGNFKLNRKLKKTLGIKTLQLAATKLELTIDGKKMLFQIPLPEHMENPYQKYFL